VLLILVTFPKVMHNDRLEPMHVLFSYLFFPTVHPTVGQMFPLLIPGWTLNYEMFFYVLFGLGLLLPALTRLVAVSAALCGLVATQFLTTVHPLTAATFYTSSKLLEFVYGMVLGWLFIGGARLPASVAWLTLLAGTLLIASGDVFALPDVLGGIPPLLIVAGAVMVERSSGVTNIRGLHLVGNASYSIYLSHTIVIALVLQLWLKTPLGHLPGGSFVFSVVELASVIAVGVLIYFYIEKSILRLGQVPRFRVSPLRS
jgi:exopolysaccharide production protein ExoZ